jgi:hypothetical protein
MQLYAFDILALNGDDLRSLPLSMRKAHLSRLLARRPDGIFTIPSNKARSAPISSAPPAAWALTDSCRSTVTVPTKPADGRPGQGEQRQASSNEAREGRVLMTLRPVGKLSAKNLAIEGEGQNPQAAV